MAKQKNEIIPILCERIKQERTLNKLTQEELAAQIGVTAQTIRAYENGKFGVPKTSVNNLAVVFGCCPEYLYGETNIFSPDDYLSDQCKQKELRNKALVKQNQIAKICRCTQEWFELSLGYRIEDDYEYTADGSFYPVTRITDPNGRVFTFHSMHEVQAFLDNYYTDIKKLFHFHLLNHIDKTVTKPTPAP